VCGTTFTQRPLVASDLGSDGILGVFLSSVMISESGSKTISTVSSRVCLHSFSSDGISEFMRPSGRVLHLVLLSFVVACCAPLRLQRPIKVHEDDWTVFGGNTQHTNRSSVALSPPLEVAWEYDASAGFGSGSPVAVDSFVFIGTLAGEVHLVNIKTGQRAGVLNVGSAVEGAPLIDGISVVAASAGGDHTLISYDYREGVVRWERDLGGIECSPLRFGYRLFVTTLDGILYCLDKASGAEIWRFEARYPIHSSPATDGKTVVFGCDHGNLYAVDLETGKLKWEFRTDRSIFVTPSIYRECVFFGSMDKTFYSLHLSDGKLVWKYVAGGRIYGTSAFSEDLVMFGATDGILYALRVEDGSVAWKFSATSIINSSPVVSGRYVYFGSLDKKLYALDSFSGALKWEYDVKGRVKTSPIVWRNYLIVAAEDRSVFAFRQVATE
jgi:outer membrane protein assembly factor BamB